MMEHLDRKGFDTGRCRVLVAKGLEEIAKAEIGMASGIQARITGPQFLERFSDVVDFVSNVVSPDGLTAAAGAAVAESLGEDA